MPKFNFFLLGRFVRRLSVPAGSTTSTKSTQVRKGKLVTGPRISRLSLSKRFRLSSVSRFFSGLGKKSTTTDNVGPSSSTPPSKVSKKSWWLKNLFTKKRSPQNTTKSQLECDSTDDECTENVRPFLFMNSDSSISVGTELLEPISITSLEYPATGSIHSYMSSSDDECVGRIITLPVFSVTQSITDIHNTCILEWDPAEKEESKEFTMQNADATTTITDEKKIAIDKQISDNVMKGEDDDEWMNEGDNEVTTAGIDLLIFLTASFLTAIIIMLIIFLL